MELKRYPLPKRRSWLLTMKLRNRLWGCCSGGRFNVVRAYSRWVWWKFYRDEK